MNVVSMHSFRTLLRTYAIFLWYNYISWSADHSLEKNWFRKLRPITLPIHVCIFWFWNFCLQHV